MKPFQNLGQTDAQALLLQAARDAVKTLDEEALARVLITAASTSQERPR